MRTKLFTLASLLAVVAACACAAAARAQGDAAADCGDDCGRAAERAARASGAGGVAYDVEGNEALGGRLRTQTLAGTPEAPVRNTRLVVENRSPVFYNYVAGWATFYGEDGVRCGEGLWKLEASRRASRSRWTRRGCV